jgi:hypothetical protein
MAEYEEKDLGTSMPEDGEMEDGYNLITTIEVDTLKMLSSERMKSLESLLK